MILRKERAEPRETVLLGADSDAKEAVFQPNKAVIGFPLSATVNGRLLGL